MIRTLDSHPLPSVEFWGSDTVTSLPVTTFRGLIWPLPRRS